MAAINLSSGVVKSMTRGVPMRPASGDFAPTPELTLLDKMSLLRLVAEERPTGLGDLIEDFRQHGTDAPVFDRLLGMVEASHQSDP